MSDEPFGRQPQPVVLTFEGDPRDVTYYRNWIATRITNGSYDSVVTQDNKLTIYPRAVND